MEERYTMSDKIWNNVNKNIEKLYRETKTQNKLLAQLVQISDTNNRALWHALGIIEADGKLKKSWWSTFFGKGKKQKEELPNRELGSDGG